MPALLFLKFIPFFLPGMHRVLQKSENKEKYHQTSGEYKHENWNHHPFPFIFSVEFILEELRKNFYYFRSISCATTKDSNKKRKVRILVLCESQSFKLRSSYPSAIWIRRIMSKIRKWQTESKMQSLISLWIGGQAPFPSYWSPKCPKWA